jgi:hypothetical protein
VAIEPTSGTPAAGPPGTSQNPLACCSFCGSPFVHPRAWTPGSNGRLRLTLRCGECRREVRGDYDAGEVAAFDRALVEARLELTALYQAVVRANMRGEAERLRAALTLDLVSADDFAGYNRRALLWSR